MSILFTLAFFITISILPLRPYLLHIMPPPGLAWNEIGVFLIPTLGLFYLYTYITHGTRNTKQAIILSLLFSLSILIISITGSIQPVNATEVLRLLVVINTAPIIIYLLNYLKPIIFAFVLLGIIVIQAQWGIAQFAIQSDLGLYILGETRLSLLEPGVANFTYKEDTKFIRAYGPYSHANSFAGSLLIGWLVLLILLCNNVYRPTDEKKRYKLSREHLLFIPLSIIAATLLLGILTAFSRVVLAALFVSFLIPLFQYKPINYSFYKLFLIPFLVILLLFTPLLIYRTTDPFDVGGQERLTGVLWNINMFLPDSLFTHLGPGQYERALKEYLENEGIAFKEWQVEPVHSVIFLILAEWGIFITLTLIILACYLFVRNKSLSKMLYYLLWFAPLLPIILLDHYIFTQTAPLLLVLCLILLYYRLLPVCYETRLKSRNVDLQ